MPAVAAAAKTNPKMRPLGSPALGRNVDHTSQSISTKHRGGAGEDFHSLNVLDGDQVEVDGVEVGLVDSYAVDNNDRCCHRLAVKTAHVDGGLEVIANLIIEHHTGLILKRLLYCLCPQRFNIVRGDDNDLLRDF